MTFLSKLRAGCLILWEVHESFSGRDCFFPVFIALLDFNELYTFFFVEVKVLFFWFVTEFEDDGISFEFHVLYESIGEEEEQLILWWSKRYLAQGIKLYFL